MLTSRDRIAGGLWGLLVGDALGVPYEFNPPTALPPLEALEMTPPPGFRRSHSSVPPGAWSDDGAQALALLASLLEKGSVDLDDYGQKLLAWLDRGYMAVDQRVFDVGNQTSAALRRLRSGVPARESGGSGERDNGNGSLMRVLPLALWHQGSDAALAEDAALQSLVTHGHVRSQVCCALYCLWARRLLAGLPDGWDDAVATLRTLYANRLAELHELDNVIRPDESPAGTGSGYVLDSLLSARMVLQAGSYEQVVKAAVALGHDTDTTACIAGGLAGIRDGVGSIPQRWMEALRGKEMVEPLLEGLLAHVASGAGAEG
jgi:ADP-ribosyl-[dinitrogen reductase] hydrolase